MLEQGAIVGYLVAALTFAYYRRQGRETTARSGGPGKSQTPGVALAVPTLVAAPALVFALSSGSPGVLVAVFVSAAIAFVLVGLSPGRTGIWGSIGDEKVYRPLASVVVSDILALARFVFFATAGGTLLARWLDIQPGVLGLLLVLALGLMIIPDWPRSIDRVDRLHGILWGASAVALVGAALFTDRAIPSGMGASELRGAADWMWLVPLFLILSLWFWLDDEFALSRIRHVKAEQRKKVVAGAAALQLIAAVVAGLTWPSLTQAVQSTTGAVEPRVPSFLHRGVFAVTMVTAVVSAMMASLHVLVEHISASPLSCKLPGTEGLRARLLGAGLIVVVLPIVEIAANSPTLTFWLVAVIIVVLVPSVLASRFLACLIPAAKISTRVWGPLSGFLFGALFLAVARTRGSDSLTELGPQLGLLCFALPLFFGGFLEGRMLLRRHRALSLSRRSYEVDSGRNSERR